MLFYFPWEGRDVGGDPSVVSKLDGEGAAPSRGLCLQIHPHELVKFNSHCQIALFKHLSYI